MGNGGAERPGGGNYVMNSSREATSMRGGGSRDAEATGEVGCKPSKGVEEVMSPRRNRTEGVAKEAVIGAGCMTEEAVKARSPTTGKKATQRKPRTTKERWQIHRRRRGGAVWSNQQTLKDGRCRENRKKK